MSDFPTPFPYGCCPMLDKPGGIVNPELPKVTGVTVAFAVPHTAKRAVFLFLPPVRLVGVVTYRQGDVLMFARLRRLLLPGSVVLPLFL